MRQSPRGPSEAQRSETRGLVAEVDTTTATALAPSRVERTPMSVANPWCLALAQRRATQMRGIDVEAKLLGNLQRGLLH